MKVLCPEGHVLKCAGHTGTWTCCDCCEREVESDDEVQMWICGRGGLNCYILCETCNEKQRRSSEGAEFEIQCPWNHKMNRYKPDAEDEWCCNFPPQGDCVAGLGDLADCSQNPGHDAWRCIEDLRVKMGGGCNTDLCGTCVEAMKHRAETLLRTDLQMPKTPPHQVEDCPNGKMFIQVVKLAKFLH